MVLTIQYSPLVQRYEDVLASRCGLKVLFIIINIIIFIIISWTDVVLSESQSYVRDYRMFSSNSFLHTTAETLRNRHNLNELGFFQEEFEAYKTIKKMFSDDMDKHMILIFNGLDTYDEEKTIGKFMLMWIDFRPAGPIMSARFC